MLKDNTTYINHITLTTGHTRRSYRREVSHEIIATLQPMILALAQSGEATLPIDDGEWRIDGPQMGKSCRVWTVWHRDNSPICTIGLATKSRCGGEIWRALHDMPMPPDDVVITDRGDVPAAPWLAVRLHIGAALHPDCQPWLGDFERCLAWAWIEHRSEK